LELDSSNQYIDQEVSITFHQFDKFKNMFSGVFSENLDDLYKSLSPKFNRDKVFNAGEGAGKSGSFFFFSHDNRFIIKTISSDEIDVYLKRID